MDDKERRRILEENGFSSKDFEEKIQNVNGRALTKMQDHVRTKEEEKERRGERNKNNNVLE